MGRTNIRQHGDGRLYDIAQRLHLSGLTDTGLEDANLGLFVHQPHRKRHSNLRIIAARAPRYIPVGREKLIQPLLDNSLAVRPRNANDGHVILIAVAFGQALQRLARVNHLQEVGFRVAVGIAFGHLGHHKIAHSPAVKFGNITVTVVTFRFQGKEQRLFRETERAAVGKQKADIGICISITTRANERGYLFNCVSHLFNLITVAKIIKTAKPTNRGEK